MSEKELIAGCARNDRKCQEALYKRHFPVMMAMCMKHTRDTDKALLILNDGFLKVFKRIDTFRHEGSLEGWIRRIVYTTMADYFKKENAYVKFMAFELPEDRPTAETAHDKLAFDDLIRLLDHVPDRSAEVFRYHAIEGYSHDEISQMMQISVGTSKWHLANAREKLKELLMTMDHVRTTSL